MDSEENTQEETVENETPQPVEDDPPPVDPWSGSGKILSDVKKLLGPGEDYDAFDRDIAMHINSGFVRLATLGVGPKSPFMILTGDETWDDFYAGANITMLQRFFFLYVKQIFDTPANATISQAYKEELDKLEWLMNSVAEYGC